ncbi:BZIP domain-containing protein [Mycena sanguinolenta]|uniref:BZIP domain-containing protein n=1 Tax=Mycena sanguinolenta TaxID=230812 RepID=A0A8H6Y349_9AGAR|nr:BZIP domain-containing protein [Mycena sanguinolenta]
MSAAPNLSLGQILANDALVSLSPVEYYSPTQDAFQFPPYSSYSESSSSSSVADSPVPTARMLKFPVADSHCMPTHQLFDFPQVSPSSSEPPSPVHHPRLSISINPVACKRSSTPDIEKPPKKRAAGERVSSKDFVPPDVSGLSKREARLVKNRAAAFLSRQRKREEFELMEVRVAELEQENARLLALAQGGAPAAPVQRKKTEANDVLRSEIEQLRAQLHAAEEREHKLNAELTAKTASHDVPPVKIEPSEPSLPLSPAPRVQSAHKAAASLGLMVLLCALPSLFPASSNSALPTSFSLPHSSLPASSSAFDFNALLPSDYDWSRTGNSVMDLDTDEKRRVTATSATTTTRKLEFSDEESAVLTGLSGLDISFDTSPLDDGKIRVRIHHPSSSVSSRAPSPGGNYATKEENPFSMFLGSSQSEPSASLSSEPYIGYPSSSGSDPFLGVGGYGSYSISPYGQDDITSVDYAESEFGVASEYSVPDSTTGGRRRVRIVLKTMPAADGEGGEWEVQLC